MDGLKPNQTAVYALGGLGEIGKNTYCIEQNDEIFIIDAGVMFPVDELLGIDYVIPNYTYLKENEEKIKGLIITHGHEDHIGGIPFLLKQVKIPVIYTGNLAKGLIMNKLEEHRLTKATKFEEITEKTTITSESFKIEFYLTTHSVPEAYGVAISTKNGTIVHTGDFKFDFTPVGPPANLGKMAQLGNKGVTLLLSDSTNSEVPGFTMSEKVVGSSIKKVFRKAEGRIIVATFASNIFRVQQIVEASIALNRKIAVFGRSMEKAIKVATELGYINMPNGTLVTANEIKKIPHNQLTIISTGSQGEAMAALSRIAQGTHKQIKIIPGDTVVFSSSPIPGNAQSIDKIINLLYRAGATVVEGKLNNIHTSGHGAQDEQRLMISLMRPRYFMPIHGESRMLKIHAQTSVETGVNPNNTIIAKNGEVIIVERGRVTKSNIRLAAEDTYVDNDTIGEIGNSVVYERRQISESGLMMAAISIDEKKRRLLSGPILLSRGFIYVNESEALIKDISQQAKAALLAYVNNPESDLSEKAIQQFLKQSIQSITDDKADRKPVILPVIHYV
ncbi:MAG: ribonuclease J [Culicoidibacterales bacterium]